MWLGVNANVSFSLMIRYLLLSMAQPGYSHYIYPFSLALGQLFDGIIIYKQRMECITCLRKVYETLFSSHGVTGLDDCKQDVASSTSVQQCSSQLGTSATSANAFSVNYVHLWRFFTLVNVTLFIFLLKYRNQSNMLFSSIQTFLSCFPMTS